MTFTTGAVTSFTDITVEPGTLYSYRIAAVSPAGVSDPSATLSVRLPAPSATGSAAIANFSARAYCEWGDNVTIGGLVITGTAGKRLLLRAVGPTLAAAGVPADAVLADPIIELHRDATLIATNDNWNTNANAADIVATGARVGATPLHSADVTSSILFVTLPAGSYSFVTHGKADTRGSVLIEADDADQRVFSKRSRSSRRGPHGSSWPCA